MNKRQVKKKRRNINKWCTDAGVKYGYRNNRIMNKEWHEFCIRLKHWSYHFNSLG